MQGYCTRCWVKGEEHEEKLLHCTTVLVLYESMYVQCRTDTLPTRSNTPTRPHPARYGYGFTRRLACTPSVLAGVRVLENTSRQNQPLLPAPHQCFIFSSPSVPASTHIITRTRTRRCSDAVSSSLASCERFRRTSAVRVHQMYSYNGVLARAQHS